MSDLVERLRWPTVIVTKKASALLGEAADRIEALEAALREMVYETTHLSPLKEDGSHECRISKDALAQARAALAPERGT